MSDLVSKPAHYTTGKIEVIDFITDQKLGYRLGNAVKYICRCNHKGNKLLDLRKAMQYICFVIREEELRAYQPTSKEDLSSEQSDPETLYTFCRDCFYYLKRKRQHRCCVPGDCCECGQKEVQCGDCRVGSDLPREYCRSSFIAAKESKNEKINPYNPDGKSGCGYPSCKLCYPENKVDEYGRTISFSTKDVHDQGA